jgi:Domain of unknown function (DUF4132)
MTPDETKLAQAVVLPERLQALVDAFIASRTPRGLAARSATPGIPTEREFVGAVLSLSGAARAHFPTGGAPALSASDEGRQLAELDPADKAKVALYAYATWSLGTEWVSPFERIFSDLLRSKLDLTRAQVVCFIEASKRLVESHRYERISSTLRNLERHVETNGNQPDTAKALNELRDLMHAKNCDSHEPGRKILKSLDALVRPATPEGAGETFVLKSDAWGDALAPRLAALSPTERALLLPMLALAAEGGDAAKPSKAWLKRARAEVERRDRDSLGTLLLEAIECWDPQRKGGWGRPALSLENQNTLRAMLWLIGIAAPQNASRRLEALARTFLTWVGFDYNSLILGNAAIHAFTLLPANTGVGGLSRLKRHLTRPGEIKTIDRALAALATEFAISPGELEEIALPDYGFDTDGRLAIETGATTVHLTITPVMTLQAEGDPDALAELKPKTDEISETLKAQRLRLERLYVTERTWPLAVWRERYLDEPLVAGFTKRLIWTFETGGKRFSGLPVANEIIGFDGARLRLEPGDVSVRLWHPMQVDAAEVLAWRETLAKLNITQPFKQAHREVYVLTDGERETGTYSNRFAGHFVAQKLFRALALTRGWQSPLLGHWNSQGNVPHKELPEPGVRVEFGVEPVDSENDKTTRAEFAHLLTGHVRFMKFLGNAVPQAIRLRDGSDFAFEGPRSDPVPLAEIHPVLFSEMMRDIDLFVALSSIGNDPSWKEREGAATIYWRTAAFGRLGETARARHAALAALLPRLAIAAQCRLEDRYLVVAGRLATYRIHLGSSNVQMGPNDQHLLLRPEKVPPLRDEIVLPFEEDPTLSLILAKAFMLAADDKIEDRSLRAQIQSL